MIHIILRGDFGNQLFQYALGRKLALQHGTDLQFILSNRLSFSDWNGAKLKKKLGVFHLPVKYQVLPPYKAKLIDALGLGRYGQGAFYRETQWGYDDSVLSLPDHSYLFGYFQSERYFSDIASIIREDLVIKRPVKTDRLISIEREIVEAESISIHVRRGDYLKSKRHNVCGGLYFSRAIKYMCEQFKSPRFFVFSDDIAWCRDNMTEDHYIFVDTRGITGSAIIDFRLMSLCSHHIISNSSFSWWAAWLNSSLNKIVVSPDRWYNDEPLNQLAVRDTIPVSWVKVPVC